MTTELILLLLGYAGWGLLVGHVVGLTAIGKALLGTPGLIVLFGMPPVTAVGTMAVAGCAMMTTGTLQHIRQRTVVLPIAVLFSITAIPAAYLTARHAAAIDEIVPLKNIIGAILIISVVVLFYRYIILRPKPRVLVVSPRAKRAAPLLGLVFGALAGATSISGSIIVIAFIMLLKLPSPHAVGTTSAVAAISLLPASVAHIGQSNVDWTAVVGLLPGVVVGSTLGARYVNRVPRQALRVVILIVLLAAAVLVIAN